MKLLILFLIIAYPIFKRKKRNLHTDGEPFLPPPATYRAK